MLLLGAEHTWELIGIRKPSSARKVRIQFSVYLFPHGLVDTAGPETAGFLWYIGVPSAHGFKTMRNSCIKSFRIFETHFYAENLGI